MEIRERIEDLLIAGVAFDDIFVNDGHEVWGNNGAYTRAEIEKTCASMETPETLPALDTADQWLRRNGFVWRVVDSGIDSSDTLSGYHSEDTLEALAAYWTIENAGGEGSFELEFDDDIAWAILPDGDRSLAARRMA